MPCRHPSSPFGCLLLTLALPEDAPSQVRTHRAASPSLLEEAICSWPNSTAPSSKLPPVRLIRPSRLITCSHLRPGIPTVDLSASGLPEYFQSYTNRNPDFVPDRVVQRPTGHINSSSGQEITRQVTRDAFNERYGREWRLNVNLQVSWDLINPARVPQIAAARDRYRASR